jgi:uncharacterized protein YxeA
MKKNIIILLIVATITSCSLFRATQTNRNEQTYTISVLEDSINVKTYEKCNLLFSKNQDSYHFYDQDGNEIIIKLDSLN